MHKQRFFRRRLSHQGKFAAFVDGADNRVMQGICESGLMVGLDEAGKGATGQCRTVVCEQARRSQIELLDDAAPIQCEIAYRREVVEFGVMGQRGFELVARLQQFAVLHLQFNLMHPQFVQQTAGIGGFRLRQRAAVLQTGLGGTAQYLKIIASSHAQSFSLPACTRNSASRRLARPMSLKVMTTPSMTLFMVR